MTSPHVNLLAPALFTAPAGGKLPTRLSGVAYSGDRVPGMNIVIDLATLRVQTPAPLLADHDARRTVGRLTDAKIANDLRIEADLYSDIDDDAKRIGAKAARGHPWQMSVGVWDFTEEYIGQGKSAAVNGREFAGPLSILRGGLLRETSIVALGADHGTSASFLSHQGTLTMDHAAQLSAAHAERDTARTQLADVTAQLAAARTEHGAKLAAVEGERDQLRVRVAELEATNRKAEVAALFKDIGWKFDDEAAKVYVSMSAESFAALAAQMRTQSALPGHLFAAVQGGGSSQAAQGGGAQGGQGGGDVLAAACGIK